MIQIDDNDSTIMAAHKIISGTRKVEETPLMRLRSCLATGKAPEVGDLAEVDMFTDEQIRELTEYLQVYLKNNGDQDADGCSGCTFIDTEEWEMPCAKCRRACKDYWRAKTWKTEKK